jgi:hypothetical protein
MSRVKSIVWKLYFAAMCLAVGSTLLFLPIEGGHELYPLADYILVPVAAAQVVGLYGYAFKQPILSEWLWRRAFPVFALNLFAGAIVGGIRFAATQDVVAGAGIIFAAPIYLVLFLPNLLANRWYAFSSPDIWKNQHAAES